LTKKYSIHRVIFGLLLIINPFSVVYSQVDTIYVDDNSLGSTIRYSAKDSIYTDLINEKVHLYGNAKVDNEDITLTAGYILVDLKNSEVFATYAITADSSKVEYPVFSDGSENITAASIKYNFNSDKGYLEELTIKQDESYIYMGIAKMHNNDEIHFKGGRFTTCDLPEPHYHFQLSKAILIPDERIVTGPVNFHIKGVPTPIGLPFSVIPQQKERTHGLLFPELVPLSNYGFGFQNLGYYIPINDRLQTSPYINLYSRGSWGIRNDLDYAKRYGYSGNLDLGFQQFRTGFPDSTLANKFSILWVHRQEARANPFWNFSSNVSFISDNQSKNNLDPLNPDYFNNSFNSDINLNRYFPGKPINMGLKMSVRQNSLTQNVSLISPVYNINVSRFFPFKKLIKGTENWKQIFSRLGVSYTLEGQNRSTFRDSLLIDGEFDAIARQFMNGVNQQMTVQTTAGFFKGTFKLTPSLTYSNKVNFQQIEKNYNVISGATEIDTLQRPGMAHELSLNAQLTTVIYSYYKFIGKKAPLLRHLLTPSIGLRYSPSLNPLDTLYTTPGGSFAVYSPFERSVYSSNVTRSAGLVSFGINNTFELKTKSEKDTVTGFRKTRIIDAFSITGAYDLMKDSMQLSDLSLNLRISPFEWFNFVATSSFSPYNWIDSTGAQTSDYAISSGRLGRFVRTDLTTTLTLTAKESRDKLDTKSTVFAENWNADFNYYALHPEYLIDFEIPWKASVSHVYSIFANTSKTELNNQSYNQIQTLVLNGDISFTKRWKLSAIINSDLKELRITNARLALTRDMHCWALSINLTPIGGNKSFLMSIRNTSSIFSSAKFDIRRPPVFL